MLRTSLFAATFAFLNAISPAMAQERVNPDDVYTNLLKLKPLKIKEDPKDDKIRRLQIQRHNTLIETMDRVYRRVIGGIWRGELGLLVFFEPHKKILETLEVLTEGEERLQALERSVAFAKHLENHLSKHAELDHPAMLPLVAAHRLDAEIRLERAKQAAKK
jgi:hypothetical protein